MAPAANIAAKLTVRKVAQLIPAALVAAKVGWAGHRFLQNDGDVAKTFAALRADVVHSYKYVTNAQYRAFKAAEAKLRELGGEYGMLADPLLALAEMLTGTKLKTVSDTLKRVRTMAEIYGQLSPAAKATVKAATALDIDKEVHDAYAGLLYRAGMNRLNGEVTKGASVSDHLQNQYLGLYSIGRSGHSLSAEAIDSLVPHLLHFHHQVNADRDSKLIDWYTTVGVSKPKGSLQKLLAKCPEVLALGVDARYIAHALGQPIKSLSFDGLKEELEKRLKL
jgi:hypothetical protein